LGGSGAYGAVKKNPKKKYTDEEVTRAKEALDRIYLKEHG